MRFYSYIDLHDTTIIFQIVRLGGPINAMIEIEVGKGLVVIETIYLWLAVREGPMDVTGNREGDK